MTSPVAHPRPKRFPAPEFPPRRPKLFARTPPAVFPVILGLLGLVLALRAGLRVLDLPLAPADLAAGIAVPVWAFAVLAYLVKLARRPAALTEDLRVLPGRGGVAAASVGGMAAAAVLAPYAPSGALAVLMVALVAHGVQAALVIRLLWSLPPEARGVNPTFHLTFVGPIVGALAATVLGWPGLASGLFWATLPVAVLVWGASAWGLTTDRPPAPLRPLLAIHVAPASVMASVAQLNGMDDLAQGMLWVAVGIAVALVGRARWLTVAGWTPLWGAFGFPLAALTGAMLTVAGGWEIPGIGMLAVSLAAIPVLLWRVLKAWPGGRLAERTNASEA